MPRPRPLASIASTAALGGVALLLGLALAGCAPMWNRVRESERIFALENARADAGRGKCEDALAHLDRAEAIMAIDHFAIESLQMRVRCYEKLGQPELQAAHRRLLDDYYSEEPMAFPAADGSSAFRVRAGAPPRFDRPPSWLSIDRPRYTVYAQRSKLVGRVIVAFRLGSNGKTTAIRVLEMPHPLLASWAIQAVAEAKPRRGLAGKVPVIESERVHVANFNFEYRWADEDPEDAPEFNGPQQMR